MSLNHRQLRYLRGLTHKLKPVVFVGDKGLSDNVRAEIEAALDHHELIKIKMRSDRQTRGEWIEEIGRAFGAERVHSIGQTASFYRRNPDRPIIELPQ